MSSIRMKALILTVVLLCSCLAGCGSKGEEANNGSAKTESKQEAGQKGEQQAEKEDEKTAEEGTDGGEENATGDSQSESKKQKNSSDKSSKKPGTQVNSSTNSGKQPTCQKTVSLNRDRLYNMMVSIYQKPTLEEMPKPSKTAFAHECKETIPSQVQYIFDWYFGIMDGGSEKELTVSAADAQLFDATAPKILNVACYYEQPNPNGMITFSIRKSEMDPVIDEQYAAYCRAVDDYNKPIKSQYDSQMATYNANIEQTKKACDLIVDAANKANIQGKDEATAVSNIIEYLCKNCEYWYEVEKNPSPDHRGEWVSECLKDHHAVCNGYAKAFYAMCYYAGIDVTYYWGHTDKDVGHAWDSVKINGQEYYFDVTWHDILMSSAAPKDTYVWASNAEFGKEHIQEGKNVTFW